MPAGLAYRGLRAEPITVDGNGFGSVLEHQGDQLLQIQIGDDSDVRGGADSRRGGLIRLACRDWIGQRHGDFFAFDHRGTIDHFVLDKRIAFHAAGYFLGLFVNLGAQIIDVRGEFVYLRVAILQLRGQSLPYLLTRIGLQLLHE